MVAESMRLTATVRSATGPRQRIDEPALDVPHALRLLDLGDHGGGLGRLGRPPMSPPWA
ncbi:hypothetical protein [Nocardia wallacei]|uniref:hypothetical protein n=1 Tax=Nocardia wallacei TaxID=480035 RepID=UPI002456F6A2|nr:hypothetical protein [Nocardia wallacei]